MCRTTGSCDLGVMDQYLLHREAVMWLLRLRPFGAGEDLIELSKQKV